VVLRVPVSVVPTPAQPPVPLVCIFFSPSISPAMAACRALARRSALRSMIAAVFCERTIA